MATPVPVLIVDGNPQMTALLQRFLARQQVKTQTVSSHADAQAVLAQQAWGVILMTAFRAPALCQQALAEGAYACLAKPFRLQEIWDIVQPPCRACQRQR